MSGIVIRFGESSPRYLDNPEVTHYEQLPGFSFLTYTVTTQLGHLRGNKSGYFLAFPLGPCAGVRQVTSKEGSLG